MKQLDLINDMPPNQNEPKSEEKTSVSPPQSVPSFLVGAKRYKSPIKGKIAYYQKILDSGNVVICLYDYGHLTKPETRIGKVWQTNFGESQSETHILSEYFGVSGRFIISLEKYQKLLMEAKKINL